MVNINSGLGDDIIRIGGWDVTSGPAFFWAGRVEIAAAGGDKTVIFESSTVLAGVGRRSTHVYLGDGDYTVIFTATDTFGLSLTHEFTFSVAQNNDYGGIAPIFYHRETLLGTGENDFLTVGAVGFDAVEGECGAFFMDGGANNDVLDVGAIT